MSETRFRFGEFEFNADSGELRRPGEEARRLPPQPARLLGLLAGARGALVSREEIRAAIWGDTEVDFDRSLHFCVRQVRDALGDEGASPRYVENLPRRGYRLMQEVSAIEAARPRSRWVLGTALLALAVGVAGLVLAVAYRSPAGAPPAVRIAIMPFEPPADAPGFANWHPVAEWILEDLATAAGKRAEIVGPTSTSGYDDSVEGLRRLATDYRLDYVVNGRFLDDADGPRMLAELIRVADGAHVWVRGYEDLSDGRRVGKEIAARVARELGLG